MMIVTMVAVVLMISLAIFTARVMKNEANEKARKEKYGFGYKRPDLDIDLSKYRNTKTLGTNIRKDRPKFGD